MEGEITDKMELEQQLKEAGEQLALPPSSTKDLLELLDKIEQHLTFVGQAPSISMQGALVPSMGALISDEVIKHSDLDVRVSVASCLCEIARITAPEPPYKDETMKEIFQLNVTAFQELSNVNGRSYNKAIHVLESVAKVKTCLLMLDLECDALVLEMFEHFLSRIRTNHPHSVFSDMETIMTMVIKESDDIDTKLLSLLLSHVRKENQNVSPAPWNLAEKVFKNCNDTLKAYSQTIIKLLKSNPDDYAEVVTALCQNPSANEPVSTKSTRSNNIHKRDVNTLENGGSSTKTLIHSQAKKQKYVDTQTVATKLDDSCHKKQLKGSQNHSARGRPTNKKSNLNQEKSTGKLEKQSTKTKGVTKGNIKISDSLYNVVIKKEDEILSQSGGAQTLSRQRNDKIQNRRTPSSKNVADGSRNKDLKDAYTLKKYGKELVGHRIKVWWPLDKMYYEGAVSSYDPTDRKHKVLYADGDEEVLDLRHEKWIMLNEMSPDQLQDQVAELPSPITTSSKRLNRKGKRRMESSVMQEEDNSTSPKSPAPLKTEPTEVCDITEIRRNVDDENSDQIQTPDVEITIPKKQRLEQKEDLVCET